MQAWTIRPEPLSILVSSDAPTGVIVSRTGGTRSISPDGDRYGFGLLGTTANTNDGDPEDYVVGGPPLILVQALSGPAPLPAISPALAGGGLVDVSTAIAAGGDVVASVALPWGASGPGGR